MVTTTARTNANPTINLGFRRGLMQVRYGDYLTVRKKLIAALGVNNRNSFYFYANGKQELKTTQMNRVAEVFSEYGITDIWGTDDETDRKAK